MSEGICRIGAEIVNVSRSQDTNSVSAQVRLRYSFPDSGESAIWTRAEVSAGTGERWRRTKRRIEASAWDWLEKYFDGACLDSDPVNIFSGEVFDGHTAAKGETSGLAPEQEEELQRELRQIELDLVA